MNSTTYVENFLHHRIALELRDCDGGEHSVSVHNTLHSPHRACVTIWKDDMADHRTPALTAGEARALAATLAYAAEEIERYEVTKEIENTGRQA